MARAFRRKGSGAQAVFVGRLDAAERGLLIGLFEQVIGVIDSDPGPGQAHPAPTPTGDEAFDAIVAGLGGIGQGVSLAAEDQAPDATHHLGARDPALERLFPAGHREDDTVAADFAALTRDSLRARKVTNLRSSIAALQGEGEGEGVHLDRGQAMALVVALTDVRLVLADRLGVQTEEDAESLHRRRGRADVDDPLDYAIAVYDFLAWLQEGLSEALLP